MPRPLNDVDSFNLLLEEYGEEMGVILCSVQQFLERRFVLLASHESRGQSVYEHFCEFTVSLVHNLLYSGIVLFEIGCHQIELLMSLPESLDLQPHVHQRFC